VFNKSLSTKQITVISFVIALMGVITSFAIHAENVYIAWSKRLLRPFYFEWPGGTNTLIGNNLNIFHFQLFFAILFLIGAVSYAASKQKQTRLLRFGFSLVSLASSLSIFFSILNSLVIHQTPHPDMLSVISSLSFFVVDLLYFYISLRVINHFNSIITLQVVEYGSDDNKGSYLVPASKWQRVFHKLVDGFIGLIAFSPFINSLIFFQRSRGFILALQEALGERVALYIFVVAYSFIYYLITEWVIGASPAKFITGTRVVTDDGQKPLFAKILRRTLLRIVPLEFITFLISTGWHDLYSGTFVAKEITANEEKDPM
jgi:uncharacterized RDD family membrane protein YckC